MKKIIIVIIIVIAIIAIVLHRSADAQTTITTSTTTTAEPDAFCPNINDLKKDPVKGNWTANNNVGAWKSYDLSFATNPIQFVGAQWIGERIGQLTCVYTSEQRFTMQGKPVVQPTLPILLIYHALTFQPNEGLWKLAKKGLYNCHSQKRDDCPFKVRVKPIVKDVLEQAEELK
ncbi:MAG: hypothetical protein ACD_42C00290G0004 [uncultured bacterium]|nr:MAG: hypothetical protein ACD_42C00290G0004 [uncultured bacterium]OGT32539.1 MAG: hypothetical protein A3C44_02195 [Gammaproteobacteria bacterium RIFCSPHIGHO2_02_FULL_39_13]OGT48347.1 MAG: hypothetical protein A3E53_05890 [Gammaproteobacteria bacterium RIFCSPHIGHO2_12_FULL_39_24]